MKSVRVVLFLLAALVGTSSLARAQLKPSLAIGGDRLQTEEEKKAARDREEAANAALARIPAQQKLTNDPWAGARDVTPAPAQPSTNLVPAKKSAAKK